MRQPEPGPGPGPPVAPGPLPSSSATTAPHPARSNSASGILPSSRRRGIGAALVRACCDEARRWGQTKIGLHHDTEDSKLDRFYKKFGFNEVTPGDYLEVDGFVLKFVSKSVALAP